MALSPIVEMLISVRTGITNVVQQSTTQWEVPVFPPLTTLNLAFTVAGNYCSIGYAFSTTAVPNAFTLISRYAGYFVSDAIQTPDALELVIEYLVFQTAAVPASVSITNNTPLNQYLAINAFWLAVQTRDDLEMLLGVLAEYNGQAAYLRNQI